MDNFFFLITQIWEFDESFELPYKMFVLFYYQFPLLFLKQNEIPEEKRQKVVEAYDMLETFLEGRDFVAGDSHTVADFCCVATVTSFAVRKIAQLEPLSP